MAHELIIAIILGLAIYILGLIIFLGFMVERIERMVRMIICKEEEDDG